MNDERARDADDGRGLGRAQFLIFCKDRHSLSASLLSRSKSNAKTAAHRQTKLNPLQTAHPYLRWVT